MDIEFMHNSVLMAVDGFAGDQHLLSNFLDTKSFGEMSDYFQLARSQGREMPFASEHDLISIRIAFDPLLDRF